MLPLTMAAPLQIDPFITPGHMTGVQKESIQNKPAEMTEKPEEMKVNEESDQKMS